MRSLFIVLTLIAQTCVCGLVLAQPSVRAAANRAASEKPGTILIRVSPSLDSAMGAAFMAARPLGDPEFSHTDINLAVLKGDSTVRNLLSGLSGLHGLRLRPFIPTHSVAFEDIRERSNPQLFGKLETGSRAGSTDRRASDLRTAEDKIAHWFVLSFSDSISDDAAAALVRKSALIERAEPKFIRHLCYTPNDPDISQQYALSLMHCFQAWDVVRCDSTMLLADVDNGTDWTHEDLANAIYLNQGEIGIDANGNDKRFNGIDDDSNGFIDDWHGWDFAGADDYTPDNDPSPGANEPDGSHGTHTAGILAATGNNGKGIAGVAFGARVIPIKIGCDVCGSLDFGFEGIIYAADMHAKVANCSWGGGSYSQAEQDVIDYAFAKDCAVVAACGNNGDSNPYQEFYPASYNHVLSVAMVNGNGNTVSGSNYNTHVDVSAPGWDVLSTVPGNGYETMSGTSMASPDAAGVVALVRQRFPNWTAGQAMQQVRVTGNPIPAISDDQTGTLENDSLRLYFEGHGAVDAFRAVTDTNTYSARIESFVIDDNNGTGSFAPGESGGIVLYVRNYLKPVRHLEGRIEVVRGASYVTLGQTIVDFGPDSTMQIVSNDPASFQMSIANNVPTNTQILVRVFFSDSSVGYTDDYDYFSFVINPSYLDLNKNNLTATFSSMGSLGYNDVLVNSEGSGFLWRDAPVSISLYGRNVLFQGGLVAGIDPNHVVDVVEGSDPNSADMDFTPSENVHYVTPPDHVNAVQELACAFTDSLADSAIQIGLRARCLAYAFNDGLAANAIVIKYVFRHRDTSGVPQASDSTAAALYTDWDIGLSGSINVTRFDSATQTAMTYRLEPGYPYIGVKLLSQPPSGATLNYHAIMNDGSQGDINPYNGLAKSDKWTAMNEFFNSAGPGDVAHTFGLKNMPLRSQDSVVMTIVIALAESPELLQQTIDETAALWSEKAAVTQRMPASAVLEVFPNPFRHSLHISWDRSGASSAMLPARVTIYDALGRTVVSQTVSGSEYDFTPPEVPSGFYTVDVLVGGTHLRRQVVAQE